MQSHTESGGMSNTEKEMAHRRLLDLKSNMEKLKGQFLSGDISAHERMLVVARKYRQQAIFISAWKSSVRFDKESGKYISVAENSENGEVVEGDSRFDTEHLASLNSEDMTYSIIKDDF